MSIRIEELLETKMNITQQHGPLPDVATVTPDLTMSDIWDVEAVSGLVRSKSNDGETPAFLFLGKKEALLLQEHLAGVFGAESVTTLNDTYYMGLDVVVIDCYSFLFAGGRKIIRTLQDPISRRPAWRDRETEGLWQFRI
ncbi:MAG: hypothetical protein NWT08_02550 [Akkermansiaceae bacterium]|jgi:hypothetical protein|nr:hypothetical protein [Akkermansiaceae bacterium]MDP4646284.1 hypothetical protein [Akkermansiaceae bacterium]MDP4721482.1 hypothetical protein [Akkermansiaceae bacterium]MDP4779875.1 hypothetical protein [Akkermansiaceae bacterium]MDP4845842.1 hypothetical protein [Akkermansiaceae bacterium]